MKTNRLFITLILLLFIMILSCGQNSDPQTLFDQYYKTPKFTETTNGIRHMEAVKSVYEDSDYETAIRLLEKVKTNPGLRFYLGIAHLELGQTQNAITILSTLVSDPKIKDRATWYLALSHLKNGDTANCATALSKLVNDSEANSPFREQARKLLPLVEN